MDNTNNIIRVPVLPYYAGDYRIEYDGKYITLFGKDKNYPGMKFNEDDEDWYEEMVLIACVLEVRKALPRITSFDDKFIFIELYYDGNKPAHL